MYVCMYVWSAFWGDPSKHRERPLLIATEKPMRLFGPNTSQKSSETRKLNGNIFVELFLSDLDEKITSASSKRERNEKQTESVRRADIYSHSSLHERRHVQVKKNLPLDSFSLRSQQLVANYFLYPYKCPDFNL